MSIRSTFTWFSAGTVLALAGAHTSFAQRIETIAASPRTVPADVALRQSAYGEGTKGHLLTWGGVAGGIIGGSAGLFGGFLAGATAAHIGECRGEDCSLGAALLGAAVGEALGVAVGAHVGSSGRGNLALAVLTSTAISAVGLISAANAEGSAPSYMIAIPVLQLAAVLAIER